MHEGNIFRQGTLGRLEALFATHDGQIVPQPEGLPTVEIVYINPDNQQMATALSTMQMFEIEPGHYFFDWRVPLDQPLLVHQVIYRGIVDELPVIGEDLFTVLAATPQCMFVPCLITTMRTYCGCTPRWCGNTGGGGCQS